MICARSASASLMVDSFLVVICPGTVAGGMTKAREYAAGADARVLAAGGTRCGSHGLSGRSRAPSEIAKSSAPIVTNAASTSGYFPQVRRERDVVHHGLSGLDANPRANVACHMNASSA